MSPGKLYLIPSFLNENNPSLIPHQVINVVKNLDVFIVENARSARRYLRAIGYKRDFDSDVVMHELNKHATQQNMSVLFKEILNGKDAGIVSEAGNPCIADPGNELVAYAHRQHITVVPLVGPSSILLALIASGFNGQQFCFHGYLPIKEQERSKKLKELEKDAKRGVTQIFMETPFRNQKLLEDLLKTMQPHTLLCIAQNLTLQTQTIHTMKIQDWKKQPLNLNKQYCIFLIG